METLVVLARLFIRMEAHTLENGEMEKNMVNEEGIKIYF